MDVDELIQVGMIGLIEASQSFDLSRGVDFEIFARTRIRGAPRIRVLAKISKSTPRDKSKLWDASIKPIMPT